MEYWKQMVGYQIYPRSFMDSNNDGIGDLKGIISKLDYLKDLGVDLIWICPTFASPMDDNGYDVSDYEDMHPDYGTMDDMDELIAEADKRGMKLMLDLVLNHTSDEHRWFKEALANPDSKYRNYYYFMESDKEPCNWRSVFGGNVWEKVDDNLYYFHAFSKKQPDLNWRNPEMREEMFGVIKRWMEKGIAGFRVDAINFLKKAPFESHPADGPDGLVSCFEYTRNVEGIDVLYKELGECFRENKAVTVSEAIGVPYDELDTYIGDKGTFSMMFDFNYTNIDVENEDYFKKLDWTIKEYRDLIYESQSKIQLKGWSAPFLENHDQPRSLNKLVKNPDYYKEGAKALAMMNLLLRGTPFIYQGEELGTVNFKRNSIEEFDDLNARSQYEQSLAAGFSVEESVGFLNERSRDNARTPFAWNKNKYGGFSEHEPWIKMSEEYPVNNVEDELSDSNSVLNFYKRVIQLRKKYKVFVDGLFEACPVNDNVVSYIRKNEEEQMLVLVNLSDKEIDISVEGEVVLNTHSEYVDTLKPYQGIVVML